MLHVIDALGLGGGAEHALATMLPRLREHGVESAVVCLLPREGGLQQRVRDEGFTVTVLPPGPLSRRVAALRRLVRAWSPDLVHATLHHACLAARLACVGLPVARLDSVVNTSYDPLRAAQLGIPRWKLQGLRLLDATTARATGTHLHVLTGAVRREVVDELGVPTTRVTVIPRGRSSAQLGEVSQERRTSARRSLGVGDDEPLVLNVGRQDGQKAQAELIRAFARVRGQHPRARLLIAGRDGDASERVQAAVAEVGGAGVELLGHREDVPELLAAADLFVFPSLYEGLGSAVIEAFALGVAVIGSDAPAIAEVLDGGDAGLVVARGDEVALTRAIDELLADDGRRRRLADAGRRRFAACYELDRVVDETVGLYQRLVG